jgi:large subunit ribosomal protein L7/L12
VTKALEQIVEDLSALSVLDMSKLKTLLEEKWGVKAAAAAPMMMAAAPAAGGAAAAPAAEATEFSVTLEKTPEDKKIGVIKFVREVTGLGLKEAKEMVEGAPKPLKASCNKAESEEISKKAAATGATVTVKPL